MRLSRPSSSAESRRAVAAALLVGRERILEEGRHRRPWYRSSPCGGTRERPFAAPARSRRTQDNPARAASFRLGIEPTTGTPSQRRPVRAARRRIWARPRPLPNRSLAGTPPERTHAPGPLGRHESGHAGTQHDPRQRGRLFRARARMVKDRRASERRLHSPSRCRTRAAAPRVPTCEADRSRDRP